FGVVTPVTVFGATVWVGVGNGLTMPGASAGAMSVRPGLAGSASGLSGALTVAFGAVISGLTGAVVGATDVTTLLGIMLACSALGGLAALAVRRAVG
ncbi:MAG: Bcr/CflA family drug resistance efflux transporter, partial [Pseudomonadota bacterium]